MQDLRYYHQSQPRRLADGKIGEQWGMPDLLGLLTQLQAQPSRTLAPGQDRTPG
ncbi:hypothetical protein [Blastomonas fulva]|jgi:hypothetical protein|uniref:hypothetical protein n=1 Tax=Blastomonas fulva TaxID=1550728 RepID=UPI003D2998A4